MIIVCHWAMGAPLRVLGYRECIFVRKGLWITTKEAYWLDYCPACIAFYTVQSGWTLGLRIIQKGPTGLIALHNMHSALYTRWEALLLAYR